MVVGIVTIVDLIRTRHRNHIDWIRRDILDNQANQEPKGQRKINVIGNTF